jgi:hypothetical protein
VTPTPIEASGVTVGLAAGGGDAASTVGGWWAGLEWQSTEGQGGADSRRKKMREGAT